MSDFYRPIKDAIVQKDVTKLKLLFQSYPEALKFMVPGFTTWLHYSVRYGSVDIVQFLIGQGFDINKGDEEGVAPLCESAQAGHYAIVEYLLDHGAVMDVSASVRNPLFAAISASIHTNAAHTPPTGEAPQIVRLLLERGIDSKKRYNTKTMKNMDAVAFAMMWGARELAHIIALWNADGDETAARKAMDEGWRIAGENTVPVPKGEQVKPS